MILFFPLPVEVPKMMKLFPTKDEKKLRAGRGFK
jgi:ribosomal protein L13E